MEFVLTRKQNKIYRVKFFKLYGTVYSFLFLIFKKMYNVHMWNRETERDVGVRVQWCAHGAEKTALEMQSSPSTVGYRL